MSLESKIEKLTTAIEALTAAMGQSPAPEAKAKAPEAKAKEPEAEAPAAENKDLGIDDLTRLCLGLSRDGHRDAIKAKLADLNVGRIGELKGEGYTAFADWAIELAERSEPSA